MAKDSAKQQQSGGTASATNWEKRYKDLQRVYTQVSQELAELKRRAVEERWVRVDERDAQIREWARRNPQEFAKWAGIELSQLGGGDTGQAAGTDESAASSAAAGAAAAGKDAASASKITLPSGAVIDPSEWSDKVFQSGTDENREFLRRYGEEGLRQLGLYRIAPGIVKASGLESEMERLRSELAKVHQELERAKAEAEVARSYAETAYDQVATQADPQIAEVRRLQQELEQDQSKWLELAEAWKVYREIQGQEGEEPESGTESEPGEGEPSQAPPEQPGGEPEPGPGPEAGAVAAEAARAGGPVAASGPTGEAATSPAAPPKMLDPAAFDQVVQEVQAELASGQAR